jgi:hypothetical protein
VRRLLGTPCIVIAGIGVLGECYQFLTLLAVGT